ncbi:MAG: hypothetical protein V4534_00615 [Myxococcota bacterium]
MTSLADLSMALQRRISGMRNLVGTFNVYSVNSLFSVELTLARLNFVGDLLHCDKSMQI